MRVKKLNSIIFILIQKFSYLCEFVSAFLNLMDIWMSDHIDHSFLDPCSNDDVVLTNLLDFVDGLFEALMKKYMKIRFSNKKLYIEEKNG